MVGYVHRIVGQTGWQGGLVSKVMTLPWPAWRKWSRCSRQSRAEESLRGPAARLLTMGLCSQTAGHTKARETPSYPLPHCNRAGISHHFVNSHSIKLLFNLASGLHRNRDESIGIPDPTDLIEVVFCCFGVKTQDASYFVTTSPNSRACSPQNCNQ